VPSDRAYAPSLRALDLVRTAMAAAAERAELHPAAASEDGLALLFALVAGIGSQHSANEPGVGFAASRLIALLDPALDMYAAYFSPDRPPTGRPGPATIAGAAGSAVEVTFARGHPLNRTVELACVDAGGADGRHQATLAIEPPSRHRNTRPRTQRQPPSASKTPAWRARRWRS
jgi:hypothetical protein